MYPLRVPAGHEWRSHSLPPRQEGPHYGPGTSDLRQVLKTKDWSYSIARRVLANGGLEVSDSFDNTLVLHRGKTQSAITNGEGRLIATCDYDVNGRPVRLTASGLVIEYVYGGDADWSEKIIRHLDGAELRRFRRADYPDPALGLQARGELRAATGDVVARLDAGGVTYTIDSAVAPRVSRAGELLYFSSRSRRRPGLATMRSASWQTARSSSFPPSPMPR